jgi:subtilisin family serine protease
MAPPLIERFSSAGGTPIMRSSSGTPLGAPVIRQKPGIVAPDGANTSFFGSDIPQDADAFPNFFGTSAAAPHAAAYAALLLELDPTLTPQTLHAHMRNTAIDMDDPITAGFDTGFDDGTGYGLVKAMAPTVSVPRNGTPGLVSAWSFPNPFGVATTIRFSLPQAGEARVGIYDTGGRRVRTVADGSFAAGAHELGWNGRDASGVPLRSGVYFVRVESPNDVQTHRIVLMR